MSANIARTERSVIPRLGFELSALLRPRIAPNHWNNAVVTGAIAPIIAATIVSETPMRSTPLGWRKIPLRDPRPALYVWYQRGTVVRHTFRVLIPSWQFSRARRLAQRTLSVSPYWLAPSTRRT